MISKSRLEELIEKGATIWVIKSSGIVERKLKNKTFTYEILGVSVSHLGVTKERWFYIDLFETEEEAKWYKEFGSITRTERLELPTWEEIQKCSLYTLYFNNKELYLYRVYFNREAEMITIEEQNEEYLECFTKIEELPLTKENYTIACRKAKELFLGEKE